MESSCFPKKFQDISVHSQGSFFIFVVSVLKLALPRLLVELAVSTVNCTVKSSFAFGWHRVVLSWHNLES